jgi:maltooligosyltrehalose synthase
VRARLNVLSEIPGEWKTAIHRWTVLNEKHKKEIRGGVFFPSNNDEYLFYQSLVGVWENSSTISVLSERLQQYMLKACKEAKLFTTWTSPNSAYEEALTQFVQNCLASNQFLNDFREFHTKIDFFGKWNSLSQLVLKMTAPGSLPSSPSSFFINNHHQIHFFFFLLNGACLKQECLTFTKEMKCGTLAWLTLTIDDLLTLKSL